MPVVFISLGSNIDPLNHLTEAVSALALAFEHLRVSPVYQSPAAGFNGADFLNVVVCAETTDSVEAVTATLRNIEDAAKRDRSQPKFSSRTLDLDLLLYDQMISHRGDLQLPRAEIIDQAFVLQPLADIASALPHPVAGKTMADLLSELEEREPRQFASLQKLDIELSAVASGR